MTITVSTTSANPVDVQNAALQAQISAVQTLVTANANGPTVQQAMVAQLDALQQQLVANLMANAASDKLVGYIQAATVLSSLTINT